MPRIEELIALIDLGREDRSLEYKESRPWADLKDKIAKTALGMANIRDGGTLVVGVSQRSGSLVAQGMTQEHIDTYDVDEVQAYVNRFADPYVRLEMYIVPHDSQSFVVIVVHAFDEIPVVCRRNGIGLRQGAVYTRSYRMPETCEVPSQTEMREIIEIATDKGVRHFLERSHRVGLSTGRAIGPTDTEKFDEQLEGL